MQGLTGSLKVSPAKRPGESSSFSWNPCELRMKVSTCSGATPMAETLAARSPRIEFTVELLPVAPFPAYHEFTVKSLPG